MPKPEQPIGRHDHSRLVAIGAGLLTARFGRRVTLTLVDPIVEDRGYRHTVLRCGLRQGPVEAPETVVLKQANAPGRGFALELAGLQLLSELPRASNVVPAVLAADRKAEVLVLEDLGSGPRLRELLRGEDGPAAEHALTEQMRTLARMHADSIGHESRFDDLVRSAGQWTHVDHAVNRLEGDLRRFASRLCLAGVEPDARLQADVAAVLSALDSGDFRCLTSGDIAPVNCIPTVGGAKLLDFEVCAYRNGAIDACFPHMRHLATTDANRLPADVKDRMSKAYRKELGDCGVEFPDDLYEKFIVSASAIWVTSICSLLEKALRADKLMILSTRRQRILAALEEFTLLGRRPGGTPLPGFQRSVSALRDALYARWSDTPSMPVFPAFRGTA